MEKSSVLLNLSLNELSNKFDEVIGFEWKIRKGSQEERSKGIRHYGIKFKNHFKTRFDRKIKDDEVVSYFDTMTLLKRLKTELSEEYKEIEIFMEFSIPYAHQKRIDYLLAFKNTVIVVEFSYIKEDNENIENSEYMTRYHDKLIQAMQYVKLIENMLDHKTRIIPMVILYMPEEDKEIEIPGNKEKNNKEINTLADLIREQYAKDTTAAEELKKNLKEII